MSDHPIHSFTRWSGRHWAAGAVIASFALFAAWSVPRGLGSLDAHGIVATVNRLVEWHRIGISRPPGHPTSEFYFLGGTAWLLRTITGQAFNPAAFLIVQGAIGVAVAAVFYDWMLQRGVLPLRAALGVFCLLASPQFLKQAVDGEEFLAGLLFLLLAVRVLSPYASDARAWRLNLSLGLFAAATGCRPELAFFGPLYYIAFVRYHRVGAPRVLAGLGVTVLALAIVWAPVLGTVGIVPPYPDGVDLRHRFAIWGYKLLFQAFGFPTALLLLGGLIAMLIKDRFRIRPTALGFEDAIAPWVAGLYCIAFWFYPTKPAFLLVALPFLIVLVVRSSRTFCLLLVLATALNSLVGIDVIRDRQIKPPYFGPGAVRQAVAGKPAYRMHYLFELAGESRPRTVVIGDAWSWDYEYAIDRRMLPARPCPQDFARGAFRLNSDDTRLLLPREYLSNLALLRGLRDRGFVLVMDRLLWRTIYSRYELAKESPDLVSVGDVPVRLVDLGVSG